MKTTAPTNAEPGQQAASEQVHSQAARQQTDKPSGHLAQLASAVNAGPQVEALEQVKKGIHESSYVQSLTGLAAQVNRGVPAQLRNVGVNEDDGRERGADVMGAKAIVQRMTKASEPDAADLSHGAQSGTVVQCMGLAITWVDDGGKVVAGNVKTTRIGKGGTAHTTAHVVIRKAIETAITGKDYSAAIDTLEFLIIEASELPGYTKAKEDVSAAVSIQQAEAQAEKALAEARSEKLPQNHNVRLNELANAYENISEASFYAHRSGKIGGVGEIEGDQEQEKMAETLKTVGDEHWVSAAAGLLDTRSWNYHYGGEDGKKVLEDVIVEHVMRLRRTIDTEKENPIPDEQIGLLIDQILHNVSAGGTRKDLGDLGKIKEQAYNRVGG